ncbi:TetR/AcrR family transcriptional regulator [Pelagovum pacificum]|uniref:TetR/AcrR family transcriptional regulator n=1 Tax=Pelagovum pacificum TaxID=2588711 RepID=A0A5C5GAJ2_9RHOB|nr:TetR/AcrR family transcriptional regulator [Pelagovum pacificum]QQA41444.1 TetR/AcrR family transcriptional regulator [Pelagovum pacificum]TNY31753.1 TetR/AcrR family transcriptional regulator [Pelagovum pacificum]
MEETKRARGPYKTGQKRRAKILQEAVEVFGTYGYSAGSLQEIAQRAGITPGAIMRHFENKAELLVEVLRHWDDAQRIDEKRHVGLAYFRSLRDVTANNVAHRGFMNLYLTLSIEASREDHPAHPFVAERYGRTMEVFTRHLREAIEGGEVAEMDDATVEYESHLLIAVLDGFALQWMIDDRVDLLAMITTYVDAMIARWKAGETYRQG